MLNFYLFEAQRPRADSELRQSSQTMSHNITYGFGESRCYGRIISTADSNALATKMLVLHLQDSQTEETEVLELIEVELCLDIQNIKAKGGVCGWHPKFHSHMRGPALNRNTQMPFNISLCFSFSILHPTLGMMKCFIFPFSKGLG